MSVDKRFHPSRYFPESGQSTAKAIFGRWSRLTHTHVRRAWLYRIFCIFIAFQIAPTACSLRSPARTTRTATGVKRRASPRPRRLGLTAAGRKIPTATPASPVCPAPVCHRRQFKRRQAAASRRSPRLARGQRKLAGPIFRTTGGFRAGLYLCRCRLYRSPSSYSGDTRRAAKRASAFIGPGQFSARRGDICSSS
jgi:hypothetical protein